MDIHLTNQGINLLQRALTGETAITFTKVQLGNGEMQEDYRNATALNSPLLEGAFSNIPTVEDNYIKLSAALDNNNIDNGFRVTERGYFAKDDDDVEILYAIGSEDDTLADFIPSVNERLFEIDFDALIFISDVTNVSAIIAGGTTWTPLVDFNAHVQNNNNPHSVTKEQVGLGNVPNVTTNDQTPTFTEAAEFATINSGEKTTILFGKIKKLFTDFITHKNASNPHKTTAADVKAASIKHNHGASDINAGEIPVVRGGTGKNTLSNGSILTGGNTVNELVGIGALFSSSTGQPEFGTLPVSLGGTGLTEGAKFIANQTTYGCYGSIVLPGGLLVQWGRLNCEGSNVTVNFQQNYADTYYVLDFTTSSDSGVMPDWRIPEKSVGSFKMKRATNIGSQVADWWAIGKAAEQ